MDRNLHKVLELSKLQFMKAAQTGKISGYRWIVNSEIHRIWAEYMALILTTLFLLHAPISQRFLFYFACQDVGGRFYLRQDYTIECFKNKHLSFMFFVVLMMILFTILFPLIILYQLCKRRKILRTPEGNNDCEGASFFFAIANAFSNCYFVIFIFFSAREIWFFVFTFQKGSRILGAARSFS